MESSNYVFCFILSRYSASNDGSHEEILTKDNSCSFPEKSYHTAKYLKCDFKF